MNAQEFKRVLALFTDDSSSVDVTKGDVIVQLRGEVVTAKIVWKDGALWVNEEGDLQLAQSWIVKRVAKVPLLVEKILEHCPEVVNFVSPSGQLVAAIESDPTGAGNAVADASDACMDQLSARVPGTTSVLYLTSDAGEGKTTIINRLAVNVARDYKKGLKDWVLLPIPMGGRAFLRFDELVVASLMQKYRFSYWFFEGFIELVRMGVVVPAFDGFEEMIVEESSGEAVSAVGSLVNQLDSEGTVLLAARKAFFEFQSFRTQARLFDAIGREDSVAFLRLSLNRWSREQFISYGKMRGEVESEAIYDMVAERFDNYAHPLLTRAVLVKRLFDVVTSLPEAEGLLKKLGAEPRDYFHEFVMSIIQREVSEKWLDKYGREGVVLLTADEQVDLLASIAREMWVGSTDVLRQDIIDVVAEMYCDETKRTPVVSRQIKDKIKIHALLTTQSGRRPGLSFDHEDFKSFFVGVALGNLCSSSGREDLRSFLRVALIPDEAADEALVIFARRCGDVNDLLARLMSIAVGESSSSFAIENIGKLLIRMLDGRNSKDSLNIASINFGPSSMMGRAISNLTFSQCYFAPTSLAESSFSGVQFEDCRFERIEIEGVDKFKVSMKDCEVLCVVDSNDEAAFDPGVITAKLRAIGVVISDQVESSESPVSEDVELMLTQRAIRIFLRSTQVNEETLRLRLGAHGVMFMEDVLPRLGKAGVLVPVPYRGSGRQSRYRLGVAMTDVQSALALASGSFDKFLENFGA